MQFKNGFQFTYGYAIIPFEEYKEKEFNNYGLNFINLKYSPSEKNQYIFKTFNRN